jgi:hypothetical protein
MRSSGVAAPPRVEAAATGTAAVVVGEPLTRAYRLPGGEPWFAEAGQVTLSAGGAAAAVRSAPETLVVHRGRERSEHELPRDVAALAIADDGTRVAVLIAGRPARVEWRRLGTSMPEATVDVGDAMRGYLQGDEELGLLAAWTATTAGTGPRPVALTTPDGVVHRFDPERAPAAVTVAGGRAWTAETEAVVGRSAVGDEIRLPGTLRERIAVAPDHRHLLLYRAERREPGGPAELHFRVVRPADGGEALAFDAEVEDLTSAFVLSAALDVLAVEPTGDGLHVRTLTAGGPDAAPD